VAAVGEDGRFQALEVEREFPGAGLRTTSVSGCAFPSPARTSMVLLAIENVTERREGERHRAQLLALAEEAAQRAERADAAKDLFLANLSHELRSPLTAILLHAQALQKGHLDGNAVKDAGATIEANTRRQARLIEDLLDVSRIVAGKIALAVEEVNWRALVLGVLEGIKPEAEAKSVQVAVECEGEAPLCMGDPERLQQVVANLFTNAVKFTPSGGRVGVRIDAIDGYARLVVTDTGRGIDPVFLPHVFERFAQESGSPAQNPGLGLGLALVHELVKLHGGTVLAESPGRSLGSTFTVMLPRHAAEEPAAG
jgi:two-component system, chemotaxis family, CheB/CheR fusion protein